MRSSTFIDCDGTLFNTMSAGPTEARPIVFVNALGSDLRIWNRTARYLEDRFHIVRFDNRGHGLSDVPMGPYTIEGLADDLASIIQSMALTRPLVCGLSIGGLIAQSFAARHPGALSGLVLVGTGMRIGSHDFWQQRIDMVREGGIAAVAEASAERWFSDEFKAKSPETVRGWINMLLRCPIDGYVGCCEVLRDTDLTASTSGLTLPTLVLNGSEDPATPPEGARAIADAIAGAQYQELPGLAHFPQIERPDLIAKLVGDFASHLAN
ncbi:MAG: 3-oxoadipate enol-lactonase [Alphaproteobacteria bacterium]|nr:3-oxoadipate enol-lactonase [Alphaproteobacteria bacterium SS10]